MIYTIHGWSFSPAVWKGTPFQAAEHLTLPGHGETPFRSTEVEGLAEEVGAYLSQKSTLVGWSLGASVALITTALFPSKVKELILLAPTLRFKGISQPEIVVKRFLRKLERNFQETVLEFRKLCSRKKLPPVALSEEEAFKLLKSFCSLDLSPWAEKVKCPVTIIVGGKDEVTKSEGAVELFYRLKVNVSLTFLPQEDHLTLLYAG